MDSVAIHCNPSVAWQAKRAPQMLAGLKALGIPAHITTNRQRESLNAIILGTTFFRGVECCAPEGDTLLVDRASVGDPDYVQLVWNGHGRRGDHKVPERRHDRWQKMKVPMYPWQGCGNKVVLCGQTETYSPHYGHLIDWYAEMAPHATHFRHHPAGGNPTDLPSHLDWSDVGMVIVLNSSVGVESVLNGIPTVTMDEGSLAWEVTSHQPGTFYTPDRTEWCQWLAWTQWHWDEIEAGLPIRHLFEEL